MPGCLMLKWGYPFNGTGVVGLEDSGISAKAEMDEFSFVEGA